MLTEVIDLQAAKFRGQLQLRTVPVSQRLNATLLRGGERRLRVQGG